jgi:hypothetical protein
LYLKYKLHVREFTAQRVSLGSAPVNAGDYQEPTLDDPQDPTRVTVYASNPASALRMAQRHLNIVHARLAYANLGTVDRTAADILYAEARARAETLTPDEREDESLHALHSEKDELRMAALFDVMHQRGELDN